METKTEYNSMGVCFCNFSFEDDACKKCGISDICKEKTMDIKLSDLLSDELKLHKKEHSPI